MSDKRVFDLVAEEILLFDLIVHDSRHRLVQYCYPAVFYQGEFLPKSFSRILFGIIKHIGSDVNIMSIANRITAMNDKELMANFNNILINPDVNYWKDKHEPFVNLKYLKELLFRRLTIERAEKIIQIANNGVSTEILAKDTYNEATKIITLDRKLLRQETSRSSESLARATADNINSKGDIVTTGFNFLNDKLGGLTRRSISSVLARPNHLKSTFSDQIVSTTVERTGKRGLIISLEDPTEERVKRIIAPRLGISLRAMRFKEIVVDPEEIVRVLTSTMKDRLYIVDVRDVLTATDAVAVITDIKPDLVVIDHVQKFQMEDMIIGLIKAVKDIEVAAVRNNCHVMITSQVPDKRLDKSTAPEASDAQWTSALYQSSAEMISLYYKYRVNADPFIQDILEVKFLKARYSDAIGSIFVKVNPDRAFIGEEIKQ